MRINTTIQEKIHRPILEKIQSIIPNTILYLTPINKLHSIKTTRQQTPIHSETHCSILKNGIHLRIPRPRVQLFSNNLEAPLLIQRMSINLKRAAIHKESD